MTTSNPIHIISNPDDGKIGIIKSPMKYEILKLLGQSEMNFDEIVENTARSKAVVSLHLKDLRKEGIVDYKSDPSDNRKRIFYMKSKMLASIDSNHTKPHINTDEMVKKLIANGNDAYLLVLIHTLKAMMAENSIEATPIFKSLGNHLGEYVFSKVYDEDFDRFIYNISRYWADNGLGYLHFHIENTIRITCHESFESSMIEKTGRPECNVAAGMFERLFLRYLDCEVRVCELQCYSMGDGKCVFEIETNR